MAEQDGLSGFDFSKINKSGKFLKFEAGKPVTIRVLTKDPVVQEKEFTNSKGEINLSTKFLFVIWNFTEEKAQILSATPKMAQTFQRVANDEDFGSNLQKCDIKISPEGEMLERVYDINVLRHSGNEKPLTSAMIDAAKEIDLDNDVKDNKGRLSKWVPQDKAETVYRDDTPPPAAPDEIAEVIDGEPLDLDSIPF